MTALITGVVVTLREQHDLGSEISLSFRQAVALREALGLAVDAETGQRGYLLTSNPAYLEPYAKAREEIPRHLHGLEASGLLQPGGVTQRLFTAKLAELERTIQLNLRGRRDEALQIVRSGAGKEMLDKIREQVAGDVIKQRDKLKSSLDRSARLSSRLVILVSALGFCAVLLALLGMSLLLRNAALEAEAVRLRAVAAAEHETQLLVRELRHRVKNLFSVVLAIVQLGARGASSTREAVGRIETRIEALARAHEVSLGQEDLKTADLATLIRAILSPYDTSGGRLELEGPDVELPSMRVTPIGMIMHELATNAMKYGAWLMPTGKVSIFWRVDRNSTALDSPLNLHLEWKETCDLPEDGTAAEDGFGTRLILAAARQLDGKLKRHLDAGGMHVTLDAPIVPAHSLDAEYSARGR